MEKLCQAIIHHVADAAVSIKHDTGQRWPKVRHSSRRDILAFRATCRGFRDASWIPYRNLIEDRVFNLSEEDLAILAEVSAHPRLASLVRTLTLGGKVFTAHGLQILDREISAHVDASDGTSGFMTTFDPEEASHAAWQRTLSARSSTPPRELRHFRSLYEQRLASQESAWSSGTPESLIIAVLSFPNLREIRICPRPCKIGYVREPSAAGGGKLTLSSIWERNHFVTTGSVNYTRCDGWRDIGRTLECVRDLAKRGLHINDLRTTSESNLRWPLSADIFKNTGFFAQLKVLQLSIREPILVNDEIYEHADAESFAQSFVDCLVAATGLKKLDLEVCTTSHIPLNSYVLALLAKTSVPYKLTHLTLEYPCVTASTLTSLLQPHESTLQSVLLMNPWLQSGTYAEVLGSCSFNVLNNLEIWKPCQDGCELYGSISGAELRKWFPMEVMMKAARNAKVVPFIGSGMAVEGGGPERRGSSVFEIWDNTFPREGRRW